MSTLGKKMVPIHFCLWDASFETMLIQWTQALWANAAHENRSENINVNYVLCID